MKIMSFNTQHCLNYLERKIDFPTMAKAITDCGADVVGLNEMRDRGEAEDYEAQTAELSRLTGLEHYYFAKAIDVHGANPYRKRHSFKISLAVGRDYPRARPCRAKIQRLLRVPLSPEGKA